jgi:hypothetical protein
MLRSRPSSAFCLLRLPRPVRAQGPSPGQPYKVPACYEVCCPGDLINNGGCDYFIQGDGTMLVAAQHARTPEPPPVQYVAYDQLQPQYLQPFPQYVQPAGPYGLSRRFGVAGWWQFQPAWGAGYSPNQMGAYTYQPVNYHGHNLHHVQRAMNGHTYQDLFTSLPSVPQNQATPTVE